MSKIILGSDGLLKLKKAGLLSALVDRHKCLIPKAVYKETVTQGKKELYEGAEQYVLELISEGRLSVSRGAEILNHSVHEIYRLAKKKNVEIGATEEQYEKGKETAKKTIS
ncbi:hypothetical protein KGY79_12785 [Candidatus Bipolaricaulota bacterium]|nr:hypothetical protein [Candidatus Bipolaricaulota bacterium]